MLFAYCMDMNFDGSIKRIERTVTVKRDLGKAADNAQFAFGAKKEGNPNLFKIIKSYCDRVFNENNVSDKGIFVTIEHSRLDGDVASVQLYEYLKKEHGNIDIVDCDDIKIYDIFSASALIKSGEKLIDRNIKSTKQTTMLLLISTLLTIFTHFSSLFQLFMPDDFELGFISLEIWLVLSGLTTILLVMSILKIRREKNKEKLIDLCEKLKNLDRSKLDNFFKTVPVGYSNIKTSIYIIKNYDKIQDVDLPAYCGLLRFLKNAGIRRQIVILFSRSDVFDEINDNLNFSKARLALDQLTIKEKKELQGESGHFNESMLKYFGADAIVYRELSGGYHSNEEKEFKEIVDASSSLSTYNQFCSPFKVLYLLVYITSKFDIFLSKDEMEKLFDVNQKISFSREEKEIFQKLIGLKRKFSFRELVSKICVACGNHMLIKHDEAFGFEKYRFKKETEEAISASITSELPDERDMLIWCLSKFLNPCFYIDIERRLYICTSLYLELSTHVFTRELPLFHKITSELLCEYESHGYFYTYEEILTIVLRFMTTYPKFNELCIETEAIKNAFFHNMYFSVGNNSWEQHVIFTKQRCKLRKGYDNKRKSEHGVPTTPKAFHILNMSQEERDSYYKNLCFTNDERSISYYCLLFELHLSSFDSIYGNAMDVYIPNKSKREMGHVITDILSIAGLVDNSMLSRNLGYIAFCANKRFAHSMNNYDDANLLFVLSTHANYPFIHILSAAIIYQFESEAIITDNSNSTFSIIQLSHCFHSGNNLQTVDFGILVNKLLESQMAKDIKTATFLTYMPYHTLYGEEISSFLKNNIAAVCSLISDVVYNTNSDRELFSLLSRLIIVHNKLEKIEIINALLTSIEKKYPEHLSCIKTALDVLLKKNINGLEEKEFTDLITNWTKRDADIAFLIYAEYVWLDEKNISLLVNPEVLGVLYETNMTGCFLMIVRFLCNPLSEEIDDLTPYVTLFRMRRKYCHVELLCNLAIDVIEKHVDYFRQDEKYFFYERIFQLHLNQIKRMAYTFDNPFMAIAYNMFLIDFMLDHKKSLELALYEPKAEGILNVNITNFSKNSFLEVQAIHDDMLNLEYVAIAKFVSQNNESIQNEICLIHGKNYVLSHIRKNAISMALLLLKHVKKYGTQELDQIEVQLNESIQLLRRLESDVMLDVHLTISETSIQGNAKKMLIGV